MKGIVLAGGLGTRLRPLTAVTNKHLLPVHTKPMLFYPLEMLAKAGIRDVMIVVGGLSPGEIIRVIQDGSEFGLENVYYAFQKNEGGIAQALALTERFVGGDTCCVVLGDNVIQDNVKLEVAKFYNGAHLFLARVHNPEDFGCPVFSEFVPKIIDIEEKPKYPKSIYAVTGIYLYDNRVFSIIKSLKPSRRGELEISDVNKHFAHTGQLGHTILTGWWGDAGYSVDGLYEVSELVRRTGANK